MLRRTVLLLGLVLAGSVRPDPAAGGEVPEAARWVAGDALIYVEAPRPEALIDRLLSERIQDALTAIPAYDRARKGPQFQQLRTLAELVAGALGTTWERALRDLTGGGVVLAVEGTDRAQRLFLVLTPKDLDVLERTHARLLELARQDAASKGTPDPVRESDYRGIKAYALNDKEAHAILRGKLVIANGGDTLRAVIDRALDGKGGSIVENADWTARRAANGPDTVAWAFARLDRLREVDPRKFAPEKVDPGQLLLFGAWLEAFRKGDWASASVNWTDERLGAEVALPTPEGGYPSGVSGYLPPEGAGAPAPLGPPGTIASLGLWRDFSSIWEARAEIFPPEFVQQLSQLDTTAGQFFGGRDFGSGVLASLGHDWRLVVARQDAGALNPTPDVILPSFALIVGLDPDDDEFALRLKAAFQTFIGLANLGAAQQKAPPLMLGSDTFENVTISTARYLPPAEPPKEDEPVPRRHNFSPSAAQVGNTFILGSSLGLTRDLVRVLKDPPAPSRDDATLRIEADGEALAGLIEQNREPLIVRNMLEKGHDRPRAEEQIGTLETLVRTLHRATLKAHDTPEGVRIRLDFDLETAP